MLLAHFLRQLFENGRVRTSNPPFVLNPDEEQSALAVLKEAHALAAASLSGEAPAYSPAAALWAAKTLYQACQFMVYREVSAEIVQKIFEDSCPESISPSVCFSADLTFRYLPDLITLARGVSPEDPLVVGLLSLAKAWPLSCVGVKDVHAEDISGFRSNHSLWQLYIDRVIDREALAHLKNPEVREAVRQCVGMFVERCPKNLQAEITA